MSKRLQDLVERISREITQNEADIEDVRALITIALNQNETLERISAENDTLKGLLEKANTRLDSVEPLTHLTQYAEGSI
jgi:hypothetical protein